MQYLQFTPDEEFDLIVVGSGNGACGFLSECLKHVPEEGHNFSLHRILDIRMGGAVATQMEMHLHFIML
jgi:hypothetical protein